MEPAAPSGEWRVIVGDEIIATGSTADNALQIAAAIVPGRDFVIRFHETATDAPIPQSALLASVRAHLAHSPIPAYLVGGAVRDALLGKESHDLDLVVPFGALRLTYRLADALQLPAYVLDEERETGRIVVAEKETMIDIARYRGADLDDDLRGRDFTINALAMPIDALTARSVYDLFGGIEDLRRGRVQIIHANSISDDPIRALRAVRFAQAFSFTITPETEVAIRAATGALANVSSERVRDELIKLISLARPDAALAELQRLGLLAVTFPEMSQSVSVEQSAPHFEPVLDHSLRVLRYVVDIERLLTDSTASSEHRLSDVARLLEPYRTGLEAHFDRRVDGGLGGKTLLRLAAAWHDVGKHSTQQIEPDGRIRFYGHDAEGAKLVARRLGSLALSNEAIDHIRRTVLGHMRPLLFANEGRPPSRRSIYRYYRALGSAGLDVALLSLADHLATYNGATDGTAWEQLLVVVDCLLAAYLNEHDRLVAPPRLLSGTELIAALDLTPGPEVGRLLRLIEEAQAAGEVATRNEALALARHHRGRAADSAAS